MLSELWSRRELIVSLVKRDLKTRYKSSVLGFLWSFCKPLLLMVVLYIVFSKFVPIRFDPPMEGADGRNFFPLFLLSGILAWNFTAVTIHEAMFAILANGSLVKKTYIPHEVFPVVTILSNLFHFLLALVVYFILMLLLGGRPTWHVALLPLIIAMQTFFVFGVSLLLGSLNVFYRDIASIMEVVIMAWFYFSPVLYPLGEPLRQIRFHQWGGWIFHVYMLNPMAPLLAAYHKALLLPGFGYEEIAATRLLIYLAITLAMSVILFLIGRAVFRYYSGRFADEV